MIDTRLRATSGMLVMLLCLSCTSRQSGFALIADREAKRALAFERLGPPIADRECRSADALSSLGPRVGRLMEKLFEAAPEATDAFIDVHVRFSRYWYILWEQECYRFEGTPVRFLLPDGSPLPTEERDPYPWPNL